MAKMRSVKTGTEFCAASHVNCIAAATQISHRDTVVRIAAEKIEGARWEPLRVSTCPHARGLAVRNLRKGETAAATLFCHVSLTSPGVEPAPNPYGPLQSRQPPLLIRPASAPVASDGSGSRVGRSLWAISSTLPRTTSARNHHRASHAVEIRRPRRAAALDILDSRRSERQKTLPPGTGKRLRLHS
jgi:hypothetical protein